jgi:HEPN domain-containing protein
MAKKKPELIIGSHTEEEKSIAALIIEKQIDKMSSSSVIDVISLLLDTLEVRLEEGHLNRQALREEMLISIYERTGKIVRKNYYETISVKEVIEDAKAGSREG